MNDYKMNYSCTLFNPGGMQGRPIFYGRTYVSHGLKLVSSPSDPTALDVVEEDFIFLNSNYYDKSSVLIVELIVTRT